MEAIRGTLAQVTDRIFFDIEIDTEDAGRIVFGMFGETTPKTVKNFVALSDGSYPISSTSGKPLSYKGSKFHRIVDNVLVQGGNIAHEVG